MANPVFTGFPIKYPSYTVITPQTGYQFNVRCLTVSEVDEVKRSTLTPNMNSKMINKIIWNAIVDKPSEIVNYDDFIRMLTLNDRAAVLYGIYHSTFGDKKEFNTICLKCGNQQIISFSLNKIFSMNPYPYSSTYKDSYKTVKATDGIVSPEMENILKEESNDQQIGVSTKEVKKKREEQKDDNKEETIPILAKKVRVELPISCVTAIIRQPSLFHEEELLQSIPFVNDQQIDLLMQTLPIEKFEYEVNNSNVVVDLRDNILIGYKQLPLKDQSVIYREYRQNFGQYDISLETNWKCNNCENINTFNMNIINQFFRVLQTL